MRELPPGPERGKLVSDLMLSLRDLLASARDAADGNENASPTPTGTASHSYGVSHRDRSELREQIETMLTPSARWSRTLAALTLLIAD
ncbi:MAG: hypothetical protein EXR43_03910 [Dehalococcoidia bacterium]|nr:hypothetical protein [Dehalococcoidia bacterium]